MRVVDAGLERSTPFLVLEYAPGESLDVVLRQSGPMPVARALPILRAVGAAIDASWLAGSGHGALHPRDIFVASGTDDVRVNGAGIGRALEALGIKAPVRRPYSAPERAAGIAWDVRSDVYSLGVIAHEMLAGRRPVTSDEADLVAAELSPEARSAVRRVLSAAVSEDPDERLASAAGFVEALAEAAGKDLPARHAAAPPAPRAQARPTPVRERPASSPAVVFAPPAPAPMEFDRPIVYHAESTDRPYPWAATLAVLAAGLVVGAAVGYQVGAGRVTTSSVVTGAPTPSPTGETSTEVRVPPPADPVVQPTPAEPTPARTAAVNAAAATGRLVIQSSPSGAMVMLDGQRVGETPLTLPAVTVGRHDLRVARPGYVPKTEQVDVVAGRGTRPVRIQLQRGAGSTVPAAVTTGLLEVDSRPRAARVSVDGRFVGETPRVIDLSEGKHVVHIALAGYRPVTSTVAIVGGVSTRLAVTLEETGLMLRPRPEVR